MLGLDQEALVNCGLLAISTAEEGRGEEGRRACLGVDALTMLFSALATLLATGLLTRSYSCAVCINSSLFLRLVNVGLPIGAKSIVEEISFTNLSPNCETADVEGTNPAGSRKLPEYRREWNGILFAMSNRPTSSLGSVSTLRSE